VAAPVPVLDRAIPAPLTFSVEHKPSPKGSLAPKGRIGQRVRLVEQVAGSKPFRVAVAYAARRAVAGRPGYPLVGPVEVHLVFAFDKPASYPKRRRCWPITRGSGDLDKLERNVLDALTDAGVVGDDSQVCRLVADKDYVGHGVAAGRAEAGAWVMVRPHPDAEVIASPPGG
jgi:Holliday junction resolvase RusA-like endonuclease